MTDILPKPVLDNLTGEPTTEYMREFNRAAGAAVWGYSLSTAVEAAAFKDDQCFNSFVYGWAAERERRGYPATNIRPQVEAVNAERYGRGKEADASIRPGSIAPLPHGIKPGDFIVSQPVQSGKTAAGMAELQRLGQEADATASSVDATLAERGKRYGAFTDHAAVAQRIKEVFYGYERSTKWYSLTPDQREGLEMIAHKIARILTGDPNYSDSWHDIAGYAKLVDDRLKKEGK